MRASGRTPEPAGSEWAGTLKEGSGDADSLSVLLLAGGRSTRFGPTDKAFASIDGTPMVRRVADRVAGVSSTLVCSCRSTQRGQLREVFTDYQNPVQVVPDPVSDAGPVAGMASGLRAIETEYVLVLACDQPFVAPVVVSRLFAAAGDTDGAVPRVDGYLQPTCAVYRTSAFEVACESALTAEHPPARDPISELDVVVLEGDSMDGAVRRSVSDVDTRDEYHLVIDRLDGDEERVTSSEP